MAEEEQAPTLRLKNGSVVDAQSAYVKWRMLEALQTQSPQTLRTLASLARGQESSVAAAERDTLQRDFLNWFTPAGAIVPLVRDVILSALRDAPDGQVVVNPFLLTTTVEQELLASIQRRDERLLRRRFGDPRDPPGHSTP